MVKETGHQGWQRGCPLAWDFDVSGGGEASGGQKGLGTTPEWTCLLRAFHAFLLVHSL